MIAILFLLSFILGLVFLVGLLSPKKVLRKSENPGRGKVLLFFGLPSLALFIAWGSMYESSWDEALKDPLSATEVSLKYKKLGILPEELEQMTNLVSLNLAKNNLHSLPAYLKDFNQLETIDLSENPIETLPFWLSEMKALKELNLDNTQLASIPDQFSDLTISYRNTPLWLVENPKTEEKEDEDNESKDAESRDDHSESLGEFALRKILEDENDYRRKYKKGEIFYNDPVTEAQVDSIGLFMISIGLFDDEQEASMLLDYTGEVYELKVVVVSEESLSDLVMESFIAIENAIQIDYFQNEDFHLVLTDGDFDTITTIK